MDESIEFGKAAATVVPDNSEQLMNLFQNCAHLLHHRKGQQRGQSWILSLLLTHSPVSQRELQSHSGMRSASLSELLCKLEAGGLILRARDVSDRRNVNIALTPAGERAAHELERDRKLCAGELFRTLSNGERAQLEEVLAKLLGAWERESGESDEERLRREQYHGVYRHIADHNS